MTGHFSPQTRRLSSATTLVTTITATATKASSPTTSRGQSSMLFKTPWRSPGQSWQLPDIIKEAWDKSLARRLLDAVSSASSSASELRAAATCHAGSPQKQRQAPSERPLWRPAVKAPDIFPLTPTRRQPKAHAEFDGKMRRILSRTKLLETNPHEHYKGMTKIGSGTNGAVVRASRRNGQGAVAIKRCLIEDHDRRHHVYVLRELRIMGCLSHRNLIALCEAGLWADYLWMAMELMSCSVFGLLFRTNAGLSEGMAVFIARECLQGLIYLHAHDYMHRDVKCENILLGSDGKVKLADFGLAAPIHAENNARLGTAKWMAPEVVAERNYNENVDTWSLAITIIEMMDRVPPLYYLDASRDIYSEILYGRPPTFQFSSPSHHLSACIGWMTHIDATQRPAAKQVLARFDDLVTSGHLTQAKQTDIATLVHQIFVDRKK